VSDVDAWDAVIVAGGAGLRLGGVSKPELVLGGLALIDRSLDAVEGARSVVVVGGPRTEGVAWTVEEPPGSGPASAIAAGLAALGTDPAPWTVVLGVDTPRAADAVPGLLAAREADGVWLVDEDGREQPLIAVYRTQALAARAVAARPGDSLRSLTGGLAMCRVQDVDGLARDVDTWEDVAYWEGVLR
jgi:molybdopterin-guanine dinucleotide biosynthesis protein A